MAVSLAPSVPKPGEENRPQWLRVFDSALRFIEWALGIVAIVALVVMSVNAVLNVVLRTFFTIQIPGSLNFTILYLLPILVFLGLGLVQAKNSHISATLVVDRFGEFGQRVFKIFNSVVILLCSATLAVVATGELVLSWGQSLGGVGALPIGPSWIFVPLGLTAVALRALWQTLVLILVPGDHGTRLDPEASDAKRSLVDA